MYKAHSKDINRNKSFHPLTFGNLSRVEKLKEKEANAKAERDARQQELLRDQEELRYNELVASSASTAAGLAGGGGLLPVKRIFAAEYAKDGATSTQQPRAESGSSSAPVPTPAPQDAHSVKFLGFMAKFKTESSADTDEHASPETAEQTRGVKRAREATGDDSATAATGGSSCTSSTEGFPRSAARLEGTAGVNAPGNAAQPERKAAVAGATGFVTTSEASQLRQRYEGVKKQRIDPLRRVEEYKNSVVAAAAAQQRQQQQQQREKEEPGTAHSSASASPASSLSAEQRAIRARIQKMMEMRQGN